MDKPRSNSGFSLIEMMIVLMGMGLIGSFMIHPMDFAMTKSNDFQSLIIHTRFIAMDLHHKMTVITDVPTEYPIRFTAQGNINMGQTIQFKRSEVVLLIATGRLYEKGISDD